MLIANNSEINIAMRARLFVGTSMEIKEHITSEGHFIKMLLNIQGFSFYSKPLCYVSWTGTLVELDFVLDKICKTCEYYSTSQQR